MENRINIPIRKVEAMYLEKEMSIHDIAKHFNCSASTIYRRLVQPKLKRCTNKTKVRVNSVLAREIMTKHINRQLHKYEVVHFRDGDAENVCLENLYLFPSMAMHSFYHGYVNKYGFIQPEVYMNTVGKKLMNTYFNTDWLYHHYIILEKRCSRMAREIDISKTSIARSLKRVLIGGQSIFSLRPPAVNGYSAK